MQTISISQEGLDYIEDRTLKFKKDIFISTLLTIGLPIGFFILKSNFFTKPIDPPLIFATTVVFLISGYGMLWRSITKKKAVQLLVKEVTIGNGMVSLLTIANQKKDINLADYKLYEGYKGSEKMKNIFGEPTYRLENWKEGKVFYFISTYFDNWDELKNNLS